MKELAAKEAEFKKRQTDAADKREEGRDAARGRRQAQRAVHARADARSSSSPPSRSALVRYNEKGEVVYVDDATRRKEREQLEIWIKAELRAT